jgi:hypothetical protein
MGKTQRSQNRKGRHRKGGEGGTLDCILRKDCTVKDYDDTIAWWKERHSPYSLKIANHIKLLKEARQAFMMDQEIKKEEDEQLLKDWNYTRKGGRKRRKTRKRSRKSTRRKSIISRIRKSFKRKGEIKALEGVAKIATDTALTM